MFNVAAVPQNVKATDFTSNLTSQGATIDLGIANDERLIEMLKKNGTIAKNATPAEAEKALQKFLKNKAAERLILLCRKLGRKSTRNRTY